MGFWARLKTLSGGKDLIPTITVSGATATVTLPDTDNAVYISSAAAATITSLVCPSHLRNRKFTFIGANNATTSVTFTHTAIGSATVNKMVLQGANRTMTRQDVLELFCDENGVWIAIGINV